MDETNEVAVDIDTEVEEDTNISEDGEEETVDLAGELEKANEAKAQILARAKKAEAELKELRRASTPSINSDPQLSEELKLIARGLSDEEIEQAKVVAKGRDISLQEAVKDPLFLTFQSDLIAKKKKEDAKLGASKGSGESQDEAGIKSDMTREDHQKVFKKIMG